MDNILEVSGLRKSYGNFALKDVAFSLPEGCITGFIGVNGAGKTTTLRTLLKRLEQSGFLGWIWSRTRSRSKTDLALFWMMDVFMKNLPCPK